jgi:hypothetical protein
VTGTYVVFNLVLGYAATKLFGQAGARLFGLRMRVDVLERRNVAAALVIAASTLATGLIFGGNLWGDADPVGDDEGGWWIVGAFFPGAPPPAASGPRCPNRHRAAAADHEPRPKHYASAQSPRFRELAQRPDAWRPQDPGPPPGIPGRANRTSSG